MPDLGHASDGLYPYLYIGAYVDGKHPRTGTRSLGVAPRSLPWLGLAGTVRRVHDVGMMTDAGSERARPLPFSHNVPDSHFEALHVLC